MQRSQQSTTGDHDAAVGGVISGEMRDHSSHNPVDSIKARLDCEMPTMRVIPQVHLSINPKKPIDHFDYHKWNPASKDKTHPFSIIDDIYDRIKANNDQEDFVCYLAGHSGSGKSHLGKLLVAYFAYREGKLAYEIKLQQALDMLGPAINAATENNLNSSRGATMIELRVDQDNKLAGCSVGCFLWQAMMVATTFAKDDPAADMTDRDAKFSKRRPKQGSNHHILEDITAAQMHGLGHRQHRVIAGTGSPDRFYAWFKTMVEVSGNKARVDAIGRAYAAIIHLGDAKYEDNINQPCGSIKLAASLIGVSAHKLRDSILEEGSAPEAWLRQCRDLAIAIASQNLTCIISTIQDHLKEPTEGMTSVIRKTVTFYDLPGFEHFHKNHLYQYIYNTAQESYQHILQCLVNDVYNGRKGQPVPMSETYAGCLSLTRCLAAAHQLAIDSEGKCDEDIYRQLGQVDRIKHFADTVRYTTDRFLEDNMGVMWEWDEVMPDLGLKGNEDEGGGREEKGSDSMAALTSQRGRGEEPIKALEEHNEHDEEEDEDHLVGNTALHQLLNIIARSKQAFRTSTSAAMIMCINPCLSVSDRHGKQYKENDVRLQLRAVGMDYIQQLLPMIMDVGFDFGSFIEKFGVDLTGSPDQATAIEEHIRKTAGGGKGLYRIVLNGNKVHLRDTLVGRLEARAAEFKKTASEDAAAQEAQELPAVLSTAGLYLTDEDEDDDVGNTTFGGSDALANWHASQALVDIEDNLAATTMELDRLKQQYGELEQQHKDLYLSHSSLGSDKSALQTRFDALNDAKEAVEKAKVQLLSQQATLVDNLETEKQERRTEVATLRAQLAASDQLTRTLKAQLETQGTHGEAQESLVKVLKGDRKQLDISLDSAKAKIVTLQAAAKKAQHEHQVLMEGYRAEIDQAHSRLAVHDRMIETQASRIGHLETRLQDNMVASIEQLVFTTDKCFELVQQENTALLNYLLDFRRPDSDARLEHLDCLYQAFKRLGTKGHPNLQVLPRLSQIVTLRSASHDLAAPESACLARLQEALSGGLAKCLVEFWRIRARSSPGKVHHSSVAEKILEFTHHHNLMGNIPSGIVDNAIQSLVNYFCRNAKTFPRLEMDQVAGIIGGSHRALNSPYQVSPTDRKHLVAMVEKSVAGFALRGSAASQHDA